jgi:hypothetical protein
MVYHIYLYFVVGPDAANRWSVLRRDLARSGSVAACFYPVFRDCLEASARSSSAG